MLREGEMVKGEGRLMQIDLRFRRFARCRWVNGHGELHRKWFEAAHLVPFDLAMQPRCLWPEGGNLELLEIEREERAARAESIAARAAARRKRRRR